MTKLNTTESKIHDHLKRRAGREVMLEEIASIIYSGRKRPKHWYGSTAATMRTLTLKCAAMGIDAVMRTSRLGRGGRAVYCIKGDKS